MAEEAAPGAARSTAGRPCSVCTHPARADIERAIATVGGLSRAAREIDACPDRRSLRRHRDNCMAGVIGQHRAEITEGMVSTAKDRAEALYRQANTLLSQARRLVREAQKEKEDTATRAKALTAAAAVVGRIAPVVELLGRMTGELRPSVSVNVILESAEFKRVLQALLSAVAPYGPEALSAVAQALQLLEAEPAPPPALATGIDEGAP